MGPDAVAVFVGARLAVRSADTEFPFRQDSDFWYLTGFDHPEAIAILSTREGPDFSLFVQERDRAAETWTGIRPGVEGAVSDYGADEAHPCGDLLSKLPDVLRGAKRIYHSLGRNLEIDARIIELQNEIRRQSRGGVLPAEELIDPRLLVHEMRLHKSAEEVRIMQRALRLAQRAGDEDEVPVGALVVRDGKILGQGWNQVEKLKDATAHAEMLALTQAFASVDEKRLEGAEIYCTLEPCLQCAGAIIHARIKRVVFGANDPKFGGVESLLRAFELDGINHRPDWRGGVLELESAELLKAFFRPLRG